MCGFCAEHGESNKRCLQMKSYQEELLRADLDRLRKRVGHIETRPDWSQRFFEQSVTPATGGDPANRE